MGRWKPTFTTAPDLQFESDSGTGTHSHDGTHRRTPHSLSPASITPIVPCQFRGGSFPAGAKATLFTRRWMLERAAATSRWHPAAGGGVHTELWRPWGGGEAPFSRRCARPSCPAACSPVERRQWNRPLGGPLPGSLGVNKTGRGGSCPSWATSLAPRSSCLARAGEQKQRPEVPGDPRGEEALVWPGGKAASDGEESRTAAGLTSSLG